jgi:hypothetical protein
MVRKQSLGMNDLTSGERQVVEYLKKNWEKRYRVTNIKQAIDALGLSYKNQVRTRIGDFLQSVYGGSDVFSKRLERWGPYPFIPTNEEKLIARCLLLNFKLSGAMPISREIAQILDMDEGDVDAALDLLNYMGFIEKHRSDSRRAYKFSRDYEKFLRGLGFTFHKITLENGESFNVQCAADALILALSDYADQKVVIKDSCFHCLERIHITIKKKKVIEQNLNGIRIIEDKKIDCGDTNFFSSEEHFQEWITNLSPTEVQRIFSPAEKKSIAIDQFELPCSSY